MKIWAYIILAGIILTAAGAASRALYKSGYNASELKWTTAQADAINEAVAEARETWQVSADAATDNIQIETEIVERIRYVDREVPKIVEKFVIAECRDLGPDIMRVFNASIAAASGQSLPVPSDSTVPDG